MRRILVLFTLILISYPAFNQDTANPQAANCTQVLRLARSVYEQGRLHELENVLSSCLDREIGKEGSFTKQEMVDALRLLCLSYIYLEEPGKADEAMKRLLNTDYFFALNPTDPAEFQALFGTFRTKPIFNYGARVGGNLNMLHVQKVYSVSSASAGNGKYNMGGSLAIAAFIEKELFPRAKDKSFLSNTTVRLEGNYVLRSNKIQFDKLMLNNNYSDMPASTASTSEAKIGNSWVDINALVRYRYKSKSPWDPYFSVGPGIGFLVSSKLNLAKFEWKEPADDGNSVTPGSSYSGPSVDIKSSFIKLPISASVAWGVSRRIGGIYFNAEARYQYGFSNLINGKNRTNFDVVQYALTFNDFNQSTFFLSVGVSVPKFSPKKLTIKK